MKAFLRKYNKVLTAISIIAAALAGYGVGSLDVGGLIGKLLSVFGVS